MATIKIYNGDTATKKLNLSDNGHTWENKGKSIKWKIVDSPESKVASIENIVVRSGGEIFSEPPALKNGKWKAKIDSHAKGNAECKYSIFWIPKGTTQSLEHDPKISVNPSITKLLIPIIAIAAVVALFWVTQNKQYRKSSVADSLD